MTASQRQSVSAAVLLCTGLTVGAVTGCGAGGTDHNDTGPSASAAEPAGGDLA